MSDTVKLIVEIPKEKLNIIKNKMYCGIYDPDLYEAISNGIPLDDVKAEMEKARRFHVGTFDDDNPIDYGIVEGFDKALKILANIGKAESEDKK